MEAVKQFGVWSLEWRCKSLRGFDSIEIAELVTTNFKSTIDSEKVKLLLVKYILENKEFINNKFDTELNRSCVEVENEEEEEFYKTLGYRKYNSISGLMVKKFEIEEEK